MTRVDQASGSSRRDPEGVSTTLLSEIVYFEVGERVPAQLLCTRLGSKRLAWVEPGEASLLVGAVLSSEPEDLALLLRDVESWLVEEALGAISFEIDGRVYLLRPRDGCAREAA
jgi:hypothetical protein